MRGRSCAMRSCQRSTRNTVSMSKTKPASGTSTPSSLKNILFALHLYVPVKHTPEFETYLVRAGIDSPRKENGKLDLRRKTFESMAKAWPELEPLRQLRHM